MMEVSLLEHDMKLMKCPIFFKIRSGEDEKEEKEGEKEEEEEGEQGRKRRDKHLARMMRNAKRRRTNGEH